MDLYYLFKILLLIFVSSFFFLLVDTDFKFTFLYLGAAPPTPACLRDRFVKFRFVSLYIFVPQISHVMFTYLHAFVS